MWSVLWITTFYDDKSIEYIHETKIALSTNEELCLLNTLLSTAVSCPRGIASSMTNHNKANWLLPIHIVGLQSVTMVEIRDFLVNIWIVYK